MATSQMSEVIQHLRRTVLLRDGVELTDGQLLEDYLSRHDEAALAALVHRHGPMVWSVCRRVLGNYHDAEDAFQAAFLVFVRKAASIAARELLANWLYGVAHTTACKARATAARRKGREKQVAEMPEPAVADQGLWHDLQPLLDAALSRLPDRYRAVLILCDLEGKTRKEAARQLGCPEGTVAGWLARARRMLAKRLARHGLAVSGGALAAVLSQKAASAGVPALVMSATIRAATLVAAGHAAATGAIPVQVAALTEGVLQAMLLTKLKAVSVVLLVVAALGSAAGLIYQTQAAEQPRAQAATGQGDEKPAARKPETKTDTDQLQGEWKLVDAEIGGRTDPDLKELKKIKWVIKGDKITIGKGDGRDASGSVKVDPTRQPKEIDITLTAGGPPAGHKSYPGIYQLNGDKLTVCYAFQADTGQPRPTEFDTREGARLVVLVRSAQEKAAGEGDKKKPAAEKERTQDADAAFDRLLLKSARDAVAREKEELLHAETSYFGLAQDDLFKKAAAERLERAKANLKLAERNLELAREAQTRTKPPATEKENNGPLEGLVNAQVEEVKAKVVEMNEALWKGDYGKAVDLMPTYLIEKQGGREKMLAAMKRVMEKMKSRFSLTSYKLGDPVFVVRGRNRYVLFPTTTQLAWAAVVDGMVTDSKTGTVMTSQAFAVGLSLDNGRTWKFVNGDQQPFRDHVEDFFGGWLRLPTLATVEAEGPEVGRPSQE